MDGHAVLIRLPADGGWRMEEDDGLQTGGRAASTGSRRIKHDAVDFCRRLIITWRYSTSCHVTAEGGEGMCVVYYTWQGWEGYFKGTVHMKIHYTDEHRSINLLRKRSRGSRSWSFYWTCRRSDISFVPITFNYATPKYILLLPKYIKVKFSIVLRCLSVFDMLMIIFSEVSCQFMSCTLIIRHKNKTQAVSRDTKLQNHAASKTN